LYSPTLYKQHLVNLVNLVHQLPLGEGQSFKSDIRFARSSDDGGSNVDNDAFGALFTYRLGGNSFTSGNQHLSGDTGFAYVAGADNALINLVQINDFGNQDEHSSIIAKRSMVLPQSRKWLSVTNC
jgi:feruloyl esterase